MPVPEVILALTGDTSTILDHGLAFPAKQRGMHSMKGSLYYCSMLRNVPSGRSYMPPTWDLTSNGFANGLANVER